jgi:ribonuclease D
MPAPESVTLPDDVLRGISAKEIADLPIGRYQGDVRLVQSEQDFEDALNDFHRERWVGFDTETRPSFKKGEFHLPCMIQAATERAVYLFRIRPDSDFRVPAELIARQETLKVGVGLTDDIRALKRLHPFEDQAMLDLGGLARQHGLKQTGVRGLTAIFLKLRIPKAAQTSNWAAPRLTSAQIQYAATDAWICRQLFLRFKSLGMIRKIEGRG